jgi:hypothetical protein
LFFVGRYGLNVLCPGESSHWLEEQTTVVGMAYIKVLPRDVSGHEVPQHPRLDLNHPRLIYCIKSESQYIVGIPK